MAFDHGGTIYAAARQLGCRPADLLDLSASINPLGISPAVRSACLAALEQIPHYPDPAALKLVQALANHYQVPTDRVVPANGSTHLIHLLPAMRPGSRALIVAPAFSEYNHALTRQGWQVSHHILSPHNGFQVDLAALSQQLEHERPQLFFFCNPANPSGRLYPPELVAALVNVCQTIGTTLVLDEAFMDFCGDEHSAMKEVVSSGCGVVLRSLTKFYALAGLRLGCAIAPPHLAERLRSLLPPWEVNTVAQFAGVAALADHQYADETRELVQAERQLLADALAHLPGLQVFPSAANYLLFRLPEMIDAPFLNQRLFKKHQILVRDCSNFVGLDSHFVRIAVRSRTENERLIDALRAELQSGGEGRIHHG